MIVGDYIEVTIGKREHKFVVVSQAPAAFGKTEFQLKNKTLSKRYDCLSFKVPTNDIVRDEIKVHKNK